ncbi:hypothetical protein AN191_03280 [Loktanella sp. 5RATIMAR09]|uniref:energy transducer TonB family protein n=1 Tax=Loktanella sp. 5RATIMAR09 TaxID=1225655 RepID=UPI0006EB93FF|nr:energy transducer TonB [Loktanella sp. 5RATIMAR09]KQI72950.1 hypothetical protein AN191_03280 [Loktanella sp. 5RATIMAR09]
MRHAGPAKLLAVSVALVAHSALALTLVAQETPQTEGGGGAAEVRLGSAFADMAAGTLSAMRPESTRSAAPAEIAPVEQIQPERITPTQSLPVMRDTTFAAPDAVQPRQARIVAEAADSLAVARAMRPQARRADFTATHPPLQAAPPRQRPQASPAPGNADRNAQAGDASGHQDAVAQQSGLGGRQQTAGNAAASNYPGLVMRILSQAGKPRVRARGAAVVSFSIGPHGGLTAVSLARPSGSDALDQAALQLVRGAGPFPTPPSGARRNFSIQIEGR